MTPTISVIIPAYNYGEFIGETIESVLAQTLESFEVVVVDDGSTDDTASIVAGFPDERIRYIYQENQGLPAARNTGIKAAKAPLIAQLDADDLYHPDKLAVATKYLEQNHNVGLLYNGRVTISSEGKPILLRGVPTSVTLRDLILGFPFAPSDVVVRRHWLERVGLYNEKRVPNSEDLDLHLRLYQDGCTFAGLPRALNYRRIHANRQFGGIEKKLVMYLDTLDSAISCTLYEPEMMVLRDIALSNHYLGFAHWALRQSETQFGLNWLATAMKLNPSLRDVTEITRRILWGSITDGGDHQQQLQTISAQVQRSYPEVAGSLSNWAIPQGFVIRGLLDIFWGRSSSGEKLLASPTVVDQLLDPHYLQLLMDQFNLLRISFGNESARMAEHRLQPYLRRFVAHTDLNSYWGEIRYSRALNEFRKGNYRHVLPTMASAINYQPSLILNRGAIAILAKSILAILTSITKIDAGMQTNGASTKRTDSRS